MIAARRQSKQVRGPNSRSKQACDECRQKHLRCDFQIPCYSCRRRTIECSLSSSKTFTPIEWKAHDNVARDQYHVSKANPTIPVASIAGFVDLTEEISQGYHVVTDNSLQDDTLKQQSQLQCLTASEIDRRQSLEPPITNERDAFYMSNYVENIGPWFDLFDSTDKHFSTIVPQLALSNRLLLYSCLAASARQYSLLNDTGSEDALEYYNLALRTLHDHLNDRGHEPATFASCLLIAHCEMIESHASDWNVHLQGTRQLVTNQGWNAASGGLAQACFWIFCRMMILASISSHARTPIDTEQWLPTPRFIDPPQWSLDSWSSKIVYLLGCSHNLRCSIHQNTRRDESGQSAARWTYLFNEIQQLGIDCPHSCRPLSVLPAKPDSFSQPFESVHYINGSIAAAWQMFYTVQMILELCSPNAGHSRNDFKINMESFARRIVSNSISNRFPVAWVTAVQLLNSAGEWLVEPLERQAYALILDNIKTRTGWNTTDNRSTEKS